MRIESNILKLNTGYEDDEKLEIPVGTEKIMIVFDEGSGWKIRCYSGGKKVRTIRLADD